MLGEQGYCGFVVWLLIHATSLIRTAWIWRTYKRRADPDTAWVAPLALALQQGHLIYLLGAMFIGIAYQPFIFMLLALQIGLHTYLVGQRQRSEEHTSELQSLMRISYAVFCLKTQTLSP